MQSMHICNVVYNQIDWKCDIEQDLNEDWIIMVILSSSWLSIWLIVNYLIYIAFHTTTMWSPCCHGLGFASMQDACMNRKCERIEYGCNQTISANKNCARMLLVNNWWKEEIFDAQN
jgi:hypothetical protein